MHYDFIEIGTSDFDTLIGSCSDDAVGLSIDPLQFYLDRLPDRPNVKKLAIAISDYDGYAPIYFIPPEDVERLNLPSWARGTNSIEAKHPIIASEIERRGLTPSIVREERVPVWSFRKLVREFDVVSVGVLKIDTEGHDPRVLEGVLRAIEDGLNPPQRIVFESNSLSIGERLSVIVRRFRAIGYDIHPETGTENMILERRSEPLRIALFIYPRWSIGMIYQAISRYISVDILDWTQCYERRRFDDYDVVVTQPGDGSKILIDSYGLPTAKTVLIAHDEWDIQHFIQYHGTGAIHAYRDYGVVSDTLASSSFALGLGRVPVVLRQGINIDTFSASPGTRLRTVGYAALMHVKNKYGVERKRGDLARRAVEAAGLEFKIAEGLSIEQMPDFYRSVDAVVCSAIHEGGPNAPFEAAAAGRLVICTPVGAFPRLAYEGMGILAPLGAEEFVRFTTETLLRYKADDKLFRAKCTVIQEAARKRDWSNVIEEWRTVFR